MVYMIIFYNARIMPKGRGQRAWGIGLSVLWITKILPLDGVFSASNWRFIVL